MAESVVGGQVLERRGLLPACLVVTRLCLSAPSSAYAITVTRVAGVLGSVDGNDYIGETPAGETGRFWVNGAWHDFSQLGLADKNTRDGPSVNIGNGRWGHTGYGGPYVRWRYPGNGRVTYSGTTWPGFKTGLDAIAGCNDAVQGYAYDTHPGAVTVRVDDAGQGMPDVAVTHDSDGAGFTGEYENPLAVIERSGEDDTLLGGARLTLSEIPDINPHPRSIK